MKLLKIYLYFIQTKLWAHEFTKSINYKFEFDSIIPLVSITTLYQSSILLDNCNLTVKWNHAFHVGVSIQNEFLVKNIEIDFIVSIYLIWLYSHYMNFLAKNKKLMEPKFLFFWYKYQSNLFYMERWQLINNEIPIQNLSWILIFSGY